MKKIKTIIIGLGNIGTGNTNNFSKFLSHSYAVSKSKYFNLIYGIDPNTKKRKLFEKKYKVQGLENINLLTQNDKIDLIVISTKPKDHLNAVKSAIKKVIPKMILIEKPVCENLKQARMLKKILIKNNIKCFVNYPRRLLKIATILKRLVKNKFMRGEILIYGGLINNGCHFIDLMNYLFGEPIKILKYNNKHKIKNKMDFSRKFKLNYTNSSILFRSQDDQKKRLSIVLMNKNLKVDWVQKLTKNYEPKIQVNILNQKKKLSKKYKINILEYQQNVYKNLLYFFKNKKNYLTDISSAIKIKKITQTVLR